MSFRFNDNKRIVTVWGANNGMVSKNVRLRRARSFAPRGGADEGRCPSNSLGYFWPEEVHLTQANAAVRESDFACKVAAVTR
ncbi:hypothetical protein AB3Y40_08485 [Yoonia sp. R2331]|uniref:hypothetical protein n=1 Tax=Yoonia sp. R2331 TaxID=3237238 RepID=UPI0034E59D9A